jgi:DnaK suppressor protein
LRGAINVPLTNDSCPAFTAPRTLGACEKRRILAATESEMSGMDIAANPPSQTIFLTNIAWQEGADIMNKQLMAKIGEDLRRKKSSLLQDLVATHTEIQAITEERESELEESAQKDRIARLTSSLKEREQRTIREIDAALERMAAGEYGLCESCGNEIGIGRLRALPAAELCIECATEREKEQHSMNLERSSGGRSREVEEFSDDG